MSGVEIHLSKSTNPFSTFSTSSSDPTMSAPASLASCCLSSDANTQTFTFFPKLFGSLILPRTFCSPFLGSIFKFMQISIVSLNLVVAVLIAISTASSTE